MFQILNKTSVRIARNGLSLFNPQEFAEILLFPISKISSIQKVDKVITIEVVSGSVYDIVCDSLHQAEARFNALSEVLSGETRAPVRDGPTPDPWALEQLK